MSIFMFSLALAWAQSAVDCLGLAKAANECCQNPTQYDSCLDSEAKSLNEKMKQRLKTERPAGLRDSGREIRERKAALKDSAALNENLANTCEAKVKACETACTPLAALDAKSALARCQTSAKLVQTLRAQASRDATAAKRLH